MSDRSTSRPFNIAACRGGTTLWIVAVIAAILLTTVTIAVVRKGSGSSASADSMRTAALARVSKMDFEITTTATGELNARNQIEIRSKLESQSTIVFVVPEGSFVKEGDLLIQLNSDKIETNIAEELLRVESSRAELVAAENGYQIQILDNASRLRDARLKLDLAELSLSQWQEGDLEKKLLQLELNIDRSDRNEKRLIEKHAQSQKLFERGFLSEDELGQHEIDMVEATSKAKTAQLENKIYENYEKPKEEKSKKGDVDQAEAQLAKVDHQNDIELVSKEASRVNRQRQLQMREERLAKYEEQLANTTIIAPSDGLVVYATSMESGRGYMMSSSQGPLQIGRQVHANERLIILPDTSEMIATVRVPENLAGKIYAGQPAIIKINAVSGKSYEGRVQSIGVLAEGGGWRDPNRREYTVKIAIDMPDGENGLKPAMRCEAQIMLGAVDDAIAVPVQAVFNDGVVRYVYVPRSGKYVRVPVKVGQRSDTYAQIVAGLEDGLDVLLREPMPGEILNSDWNKAQLELVGLTLSEDGKPSLGDRPANGRRMRDRMPTGDIKATMGPESAARPGGRQMRGTNDRNPASTEADKSDTDDSKDHTPAQQPRRQGRRGDH